jgi:hypothetical protein
MHIEMEENHFPPLNLSKIQKFANVLCCQICGKVGILMCGWCDCKAENILEEN